MILVDSSVWIDHLRNPDKQLIQWLLAEQVLCHPFIIGEILMGSLAQRKQVAAILDDLDKVVMAKDDEVRHFVELHEIYSRGIGWVDAHLLVSAALGDARLVTRDRRLANVAGELGLVQD